MAEQNGSATVEAVQATELKGKGKATAEPENDVSMETGDDSSSEEELDDAAPIADDDDPDTMEEINQENIVGRRTRGRQIDFAKAAEQLPADDDEDEDEDDDFVAPEDDDDKMEE